MVRRVSLGLADYSISLNYDNLPKDVIHEAKRRVLDTLGCAVAAFNAEPVRIAREAALEIQSSAKPATILGTDKKTSGEMAAFVGAVMARSLHFNDAPPDTNVGGHPSDNIAVCLSVADSLHSTGKDLLTSVVLAYEIHCTFSDLCNGKKAGWDYANETLLGSTLATARLFGLGPEATTQALNIALNGHMAMRQVRKGEECTWEECSSAEAGRCAVFSTILAAKGMTGPSPIFEGEFGFFKQVSGPLRVNPKHFGENGDFKIKRAHLKLFPGETATHAAARAALQAKKKINNIADISKIELEVTTRNYEQCGKTPDRWAPKTKSVADHSIPYTTAVGLIDGEVSLASYEDARLVDAEILNLMRKITVSPSPTLETRFPQQEACIMRIFLNSGSQVVEEVHYPKFPISDPATDEELETKFRHNIKGFLTPSQSDAITRTIWELDRLDDVTDLIDKIVVGSRE